MVCKIIFGPLLRFGLSIVGIKMVAILDLVYKSRTYVAEMYFIGFVDLENISLGTKNICLAGLEIWRMDTAAILKNALFSLFWTRFVTRSNIFSHIKIYQIKSRNLICQTRPQNFVLGLS